jgi:formylglycine-generating enzyme required for sulfatase activity
MQGIARIFLVVAVLGWPTWAVSQTAKASGAPAGSVFDDCSGGAWCPKMVVIPKGSFLMGNPGGETETPFKTGPQHTVTIPYNFAVSEFDVTRGQWAAFVAATSRVIPDGCSWSMLPKEQEAKASWHHLGFSQDDSHPAVCVTFRDAEDYVAWLTKKTGHPYRLLSEAEWEYAARAGSTGPFQWGKKASHEYVNYGTEEKAGWGVALGRNKWEFTSPVGSFPPNAFGLYDTNGNVMQWVEDCLASSYSSVPTDGSAFLANVPVTGMKEWLSPMNGTSSCSYRMLRGGCWGDPPSMIGSASRNTAPAVGDTLENYRSSGLGIRVARRLD